MTRTILLAQLVQQFILDMYAPFPAQYDAATGPIAAVIHDNIAGPFI